MAPPRASQTLEPYLARFEAEFPAGDLVRKLLKAADCEPIFAVRVSHPFKAPYGSWVLHVHLPHRLQDHFGITRQFLLYCLNVVDLQPRDVTQIQKLIGSAEHPIETDFAVIVCRDPQAPEKIADWGIERTLGIVLVPIVVDQLEDHLRTDNALSKLISVWLAAQNLYDQRDPVTGDRFFGRADKLRDLDRKISQNRGHVGIFGLRRIGKTSLLLELNERLRKRTGIIPIFIDLEGSAATAHAAFRVGDKLAEILEARTELSMKGARRALNIPDHWEQASAVSLIANVGDGLRGLLENGALRDQHVVLILDEAEILLPSPEEPLEHAVQLFRVLRAVATETQRLSLVIAGVNATPSESPVLGPSDNPLFGLLSVEYLGPLEPADCVEMLKRVGRKMQIRWEPAPLNLIAEKVGSHPLLARLAGSDVTIDNPERPLRPNNDTARAVLRDFHRRHSRIFEQMVQSLRRYYPDEFDFLEILASGDVDFAYQAIDENPSLLNHLAGYGVMNARTLEIAIPVFGDWLRLRKATR